MVYLDWKENNNVFELVSCSSMAIKQNLLLKDRVKAKGKKENGKTV